MSEKVGGSEYCCDEF